MMTPDLENQQNKQKYENTKTGYGQEQGVEPQPRTVEQVVNVTLTVETGGRQCESSWGDERCGPMGIRWLMALASCFCCPW